MPNPSSTNDATSSAHIDGSAQMPSTTSDFIATTTKHSNGDDNSSKHLEDNVKNIALDNAGNSSKSLSDNEHIQVPRNSEKHHQEADSLLTTNATTESSTTNNTANNNTNSINSVNNNTGLSKSAKKKKRRSKAKKIPISTAKTTPSDPNNAADHQSRHHDSPSSNATNLPRPAPPGSLKPTNSPLSPRKQAIMRYKKSDDQMNGQNFISEAKENMKNKRRSPPTSTIATDEDDKYSTLLAQQNMEGKASLFKFSSSKILVYHEQLNDDNSESQSQSSGRLLGHGEFEVFQLHNGDVTYLSCGPSFVYPLLPKLKILRIASNQFILPLVNPERYWKIFINTDDPSIIQNLENSLKSLVQYRNLFFGPNQVAWNTQTSKEISVSNDNENKSTQYQYRKVGFDANNNPVLEINLKPSELKTSSIKDDLSITGSHVLLEDDDINDKSIEVSEVDDNINRIENKINPNDEPTTHHLGPKTIIPQNDNFAERTDYVDEPRNNQPNSTISIFAAIPESPPSLSASPQPILDGDFAELSISKPALKSEFATGLRYLNRQNSMNSITSAMASFDINNTSTTGNTTTIPNPVAYTPDKLHNKAVINSAKPRVESHRTQPRLNDIIEQRLPQAEPEINHKTSPQVYKKIYQPKPSKGSHQLQAQNQFTPAMVSQRYHDRGQGFEKQHESGWYNSNIDDTRSESSMDSLLDEYEEHLSVSKSITFTRSRPPSRSVSERHDLNNISNYQLKSWNLRGGEAPNLLSNLETSEIGEEDEDANLFPSTSLSEYNKTRLNNPNYNSSNRSRRSSHSELYTSVSNWMEPGAKDKQHASASDSHHQHHHRSQASGKPSGGKAYSIANGYQENSLPGKESGQLLNNAYHHIYKSITQRNLSSILNENETPKTRSSRLQYNHPKPVKMASQSSLHRKGSYAGSLVGATPSRNSGVNPGDVYDNLLNSHHHHQYQHHRQLPPPQPRSRSGSRVSEYSQSQSIGNLQNYTLNDKPRGNTDHVTAPRSKSSRKGDKIKDNSKASKGFTSKLFGW